MIGIFLHVQIFRPLDLLTCLRSLLVMDFSFGGGIEKFCYRTSFAGIPKPVDSLARTDAGVDVVH